MKQIIFQYVPKDGLKLYNMIQVIDETELIVEVTENQNIDTCDGESDSAPFTNSIKLSREEVERLRDSLTRWLEK